jgi:hypothetical protein
MAKRTNKSERFFSKACVTCGGHGRHDNMGHPYMANHPTPGPYSTEVKGEWYGVTIPPWLRAFDCRCEAGKEFSYISPWGATLMGSERAEVDVGLRGASYDDCHGTSPTSCQTYIDARTASEDELRKQVSDMVREATKLRDEYLHQATLPETPGQGGSCYYMPVLVALSNFGWSIVSDRRQCVVRSYQG